MAALLALFRTWNRSLLVALAIALTAAGLASAAPEELRWTTAVNLSNTPGRSMGSTLALDPISGDMFVAWTDDGIATREEIVGRRWDHAARGWLPTENLSQSAEWERDGGPRIVFDQQGHGLLIWTRTYSVSQGAPAAGHDVMWRAWDGQAWSPAQVLFHGDAYLPGSPGSFELITVERMDSILLFIIWGTGYRTAEYYAGGWSEVAPWIYLDVFLTQVIADGQGTLHAAAAGPNSNQFGSNHWFHDAYYLFHDGATWSEPANLSGTDGIASSIGLSFDGHGRLHFLWSDPDSPYSDESLKSAIWERVYEGGTWSPNVEATPYENDQAINGFSLAEGISGTLHLAWSQGLMVDGTHTSLDLYYQSGDGASWGPPQQVYTSTANSRYPTLIQAGAFSSLVWEDEFDAGAPLLDREVYAIRQVDWPLPSTRVFVPQVSK